MPSTGSGRAVSLCLSLCLFTAGAGFELQVSPGRIVWARQGEPLTLSCRDSGCPDTSSRLFWSISGDSILGGKVTGGTSETQLTFDNVTADHYNTYSCKGFCGDQTREFKVRVKVYDVSTTLSLEPAVPVWAGKPVSVICHVDASFPVKVLRVQWFAGTELLETISADSLTDTELPIDLTHQLTPQIEHQGQELSCVAHLNIEGTTGEIKSESRNHSLNVLYGPLITLNRAAVFTATKGQNVTVTCTAPSNPPASISWSKLGSQDRLPISAQEATLKLYDIGFSDSGTYRCEASNGIERDTKELQIQIEGAPSGTRLSITPSVAKQGVNVTITCTTSSYPLAQFVLRHSGGGLPKLPSSNGTFTIISVQSANSGQYECEATNSLGMDTASEKLSVQDDPQSTTFARGTASTITTVPPQYLVVIVSPSRTFRKGQNLTFSCMANSSSPALYTWTKQGNETLLSSSNTFTILSATDHHAGVYQVTVSNELGSKTGTVEIMITGERKDKEPGSPLVYLAVGGVSLGGLLGGLLWYRKMNLSKSLNLVPDQIL